MIIVMMMMMMMMMMMILDPPPDHVTTRNSFSGVWLAGTSSVTSLEGDDVTMWCIFSGRYVCACVCVWRLLVNQLSLH